MDAVEFIKERQRMCNTHKEECAGCPMDGWPCGGYRDVNAERLVGAVEEWSAAHPRKTRQSVFLEQYPNARIADGTLSCPLVVEGKYQPTGGCMNTKCLDCCREFWMQEVD